MQRLLNKEIDERLIVKLNSNIKREGVNGVMMFGEENNYPQTIEKLINSSVTAKAAVNIYSKFLTGQGFENEAINNVVIGKDSRGKEITMLSLLRQSATSAAKHNGYYWHVQINMNGVINEVKLMPFKDCRFAKPDDTGYAAKILYYDNWNKEICYKKFDKDKILDYFIFNLNKDVIAAQFKEVGQKHKGQVYFQFLDNDYFYPLSPFDAAYLDMDTEYQIQLFKNRQIRDGFFDTILMRVAASGTDEEKEEFANDIKMQLGPDGNKVIIFEDDVDENGNISETGAFKVDKINTTVNDKLFENWEKGLANNIRKTIKGIPAILIDYEENRLGNTSGEAIIQATNFYNALTKDDRALLSNSFKEIFSNHSNPLLSGNTNWNIKQLSLIENGNSQFNISTTN